MDPDPMAFGVTRMEEAREAADEGIFFENK